MLRDARNALMHRALVGRQNAFIESVAYERVLEPEGAAAQCRIRLHELLQDESAERHGNRHGRASRPFEGVAQEVPAEHGGELQQRPLIGGRASTRLMTRCCRLPGST